MDVERLNLGVSGRRRRTGGDYGFWYSYEPCRRYGGYLLDEQEHVLVRQQLLHVHHRLKRFVARRYQRPPERDVAGLRLFRRGSAWSWLQRLRMPGVCTGLQRLAGSWSGLPGIHRWSELLAGNPGTLPSGQY